MGRSQVPTPHSAHSILGNRPPPPRWLRGLPGPAWPRWLAGLLGSVPACGCKAPMEAPEPQPWCGLQAPLPLYAFRPPQTAWQPRGNIADQLPPPWSGLVPVAPSIAQCRGPEDHTRAGEQTHLGLPRSGCARIKPVRRAFPLPAAPPTRRLLSVGAPVASTVSCFGPVSPPEVGLAVSLGRTEGRVPFPAKASTACWDTSLHLTGALLPCALSKPGEVNDTPKTHLPPKGHQETGEQPILFKKK